MKKITGYFSLMLLLFVLVLSACNTSNDDKQDTTNENANSNKEDYPTKTIEMIVPFDPGGSTDTTARIAAEAISEYLPNNEKVVIKNLPGASGTKGLTELLQSDEDGYTIGFTPAGALSLQPLYGNTAYDYDSFQPIARISTSPMLLLVKEDAPWDTFEEWLEWVKDNPGEFSYGSSGKGNPGNIAMEKLINELDLDVKHIAYEGQSEVFADLLGGHIDASSGSSQEGKDLVESGELKILVNLGTLKDDWFKDATTLIDNDINVSTDLYFGVIAP